MQYLFIFILMHFSTCWIGQVGSRIKSNDNYKTLGVCLPGKRLEYLVLTAVFPGGLGLAGIKCLHSKLYWCYDGGGGDDCIENSNQIVITNKPTPNFLQT